VQVQSDENTGSEANSLPASARHTTDVPEGAFARPKLHLPAFQRLMAVRCCAHVCMHACMHAPSSFPCAVCWLAVLATIDAFC
jgi:hypothetical protein